MKKVGTIVITNGNLLVTDPCYDKGTWCAYKFNALSGKYNVYVNQYIKKYIDESKIEEKNVVYKILDLAIIHESLPEELVYKINGNTRKHAGVDSGQCGFFDFDQYPDVPDDRCFEPGKKKNLEETWYGHICDNNNYETGFIADYGCASHTFYGDGSYPIFTRKNNKGLVVAARLDYVGNTQERKELMH